ncbi:MAG: hypothetical protein HKN14_04290 [Marinicaulis sp.]|nr:hypothetical protein [Marinicaulis sp.]NNL90252.1 hypothetical protein [Marinicaulis sp.]
MRKEVLAKIVIAFIALAVAACATVVGADQYAAHGYLTPGPTSEPELIGVFDTVDECRDAADAWASRQVVGNPVHADCYPVDTD